MSDPRFDNTHLVHPGMKFNTAIAYPTGRIVVTADAVSTGRYGEIDAPVGVRKEHQDLPSAWTPITANTQTTITPSTSGQRWRIECTAGVLVVKGQPAP
jgi:hypothetical protein